MPKRLLFICQYFHPESFRGNDIAYYLAQRGVEVTVLCGTPNYPKGKFFEGYSWFKRNRELVNGVRVIRMPIIPRGNGNNLKLLLNYFSYFTIASIFLPFHLLLNKKYDVCFVQQLSPVMMAIPGVLFKKLTRRKLYTWVLDLWPESLKAAGGIKNKWILKFFSWFSKLEYANSDKILISSKGFANNISVKGDYTNKISYMPNWAEDEINSGEFLPIPSLPDGFNVLFAGNIGEAQDFESILEACRILEDKEDIHFVIVGDGRKREWIEQQIIDYNLQNKIHMLGRFDMKYMFSFFSKADCLLLALKDDEILNLTVPAKLQAYMTTGKPIIGMINGAANELIKESKCGKCVSASSPISLVAAIREMKSLSNEERLNMGENGREFCKRFFSKQMILSDLYDLMFGE